VATLEERVTVLEARVDVLAVKVERDHEIAWTSYREAQDARVWHRQNVELLRAVRETQIQQGETLEEHLQQLAEHGRLLAEHGRRLDGIDGKLGMLTVGMHDIQRMLKHLIDRENGAEAGPAAS
jgi:hypothetical protein